MKKIDFHIHTKATNKDAPFEFSLDALKNYVQELSIDAIAITNHNCFDKNQFQSIVMELTDVIVFPGIEIDLDNGHILVIAPPDMLDEFSSLCKQLENKFTDGVNSIEYTHFIDVFTDLDKYLLIPHYHKDPSISDTILTNLHKYIEAGEVQSPKKFERCKKEDGLSPVLFSDWRAVQSENEPFYARQTFLNCDELTISKIKYALKDKNNVSLINNIQEQVFQMLADGTIASTSLNVMLGKRSSGKTHTLNTIAKNYPAENIKYIRQFDLVSKSDDDKFAQIIKREKDEFTTSYFCELKSLLEYISIFNWDENIAKIETNIKTLKKFAANKEKEDIYSKVLLFAESTLSTNSLVDLKKLIDALITIINDNKYETEVAKWIDKSKLKNLCLELIHKYNKMNLENRLIYETNNLVKYIKDALGRKSALSPVEDVDFAEQFLLIVIEHKFNELIHAGGEKRIVHSEPMFGFFIETEVSRITNATDINNACEIRNTTNLIKLHTHPFELYRKLKKEKELFNIRTEDIHKAFLKLTYRVKNSFDSELSGGEKAEYNLLAELKDAYKYEIVLIDEPESSFDNTFIKESVVNSIKELSAKSTVFVVTHNNTIGMLLNPDFIIYTEKEMLEDKTSYFVYTGKLTSQKLKSVCGKEKDNYLLLMETMEAGEEAYETRRELYETVKN